MKDAIDKRNERDKIARSIVKRRNIVYISKEELERKQQEEEQQRKKEARKAAEDLVKQLKEEENRKQAMDIERLLAEQAMLERQLETGMDATGKNPMSGVTQERVEAILSEKSKQLQEIIAANRLELEQKHTSVETHLSKNDRKDGTGAEGESLENDGSAGETDPENDSFPGENAQELVSEELEMEEMEEADAAPEQTNSREEDAALEMEDIEEEPVPEMEGIEAGAALEDSSVEEGSVSEIENGTEGEIEA